MNNIFFSLVLLLSILFYNKIYFYFNKKIIFYNYFIKFIYYTIVIIILFYYFFKNKDFSEGYIQSLFACYLISFFSIFFTVSLKAYESPTNLIYKFLKKNSQHKKLLLFLKKKNIVLSRINDLKNQKLIKEKKNKIFLTKLGYSFCKLYFNLMIFLKIKNEG